MTKAEFITAIVEKAQTSKTQTEAVVNGFLETIKECLQKGDKMTFPGFGTFSVKERSARTGRNPRTGEPLKISARNAPHFSAGSQLKEAVNTKPKKAAKKTAKKKEAATA